MGDHADDAIGEMFDLEEAWERDPESFAEGLDEGYPHVFSRFGPVRVRVISCRYCGESGLTWIQTQAGWRLARDGAVHSCARYRSPDAEA